MKKCLFYFALALIVSTTISAQQPVIVEIPPMLMMNPLTPDEVNIVRGAFARALSEARNFRFINQLVLERGMRDYEFQQSDWANLEKTIAFCEVLNIDWVLRTQIQKRIVNERNSSIIMSAVLLNVRTKEIMYTTPVLITNPNEASNNMQAHINEITKIVTGEARGLIQSEQSLYRVGDRGPAGGWIFHDKGNYRDGWRYLEIAPRETETSVPRTRYVERINDLRREIGSGKRNTELILQSNLNQDDFTIIRAARICVNLELNWFKDWFLPSEAEMSWFRGHPNNFAELNISYYWTSSGGSNSWFAIPGRLLPDRDMPNYLVRAVRAF